MSQADATSAPPLPGEGPPPTLRSPGPSVRPALVVVGIALFLILLFGIGAALTGTSTPQAPSPKVVRGTSLASEPATEPLRPIELVGTPPTDVLDALVLPKGAHAVSAVPWDKETQFDGKMVFRLPASQAAIVDFFRAELKARGWSIENVGAARGQPGATEVLAQRASTDGWYWEVGAIVSPTTFGKGTSNTQDTTPFTLELFEVPDAT